MTESTNSYDHSTASRMPAATLNVTTRAVRGRRSTPMVGVDLTVCTVLMSQPPLIGISSQYSGPRTLGRLPDCLIPVNNSVPARDAGDVPGRWLVRDWSAFYGLDRWIVGSRFVSVGFRWYAAHQRCTGDSRHRCGR